MTTVEAAGAVVRASEAETKTQGLLYDMVDATEGPVCAPRYDRLYQERKRIELATDPASYWAVQLLVSNSVAAQAEAMVRRRRAGGVR